MHAYMHTYTCTYISIHTSERVRAPSHKREGAPLHGLGQHGLCITADRRFDGEVLHCAAVLAELPCMYAYVYVCMYVCTVDVLSKKLTTDALQRGIKALHYNMIVEFELLFKALLNLRLAQWVQWVQRTKHEIAMRPVHLDDDFDDGPRASLGMQQVRRSLMYT